MIVNEPLLDRAREHAVRFLRSLPSRHVGPTAARHAVLRRAGWNVEENGLAGAPRLHVIAGAEAHITIHAALRMLGLGTRDTIKVDTDEQGRMRPEALERALAALDGPIIVSAQA